MRSILLLCVLGALGLACGSEPSKPEPSPAKTPPASAPAAAGQVYDVICGCKIESIKRCGNYAKVGDAYAEIVGDVGLGVMEFCGKSGLKAEIPGKVENGKLLATSFRLIKD